MDPSAFDVAARVAGGVVAYLGIGLALTPAFVRWNDWDNRVNWRLDATGTSPAERGGFVLLWPVALLCIPIMLGGPAVLKGIGRLSEWISGGDDPA